ncbi:hypothetical protein GCM10009117_12370 [Gangjinia marincola]|uniref:Bleomycin resistance protein n=1 Tax=Gangjinia marincola TaxID=578463 RepID=A0ABN1MFZ7_9FLAO
MKGKKGNGFLAEVHPVLPVWDVMEALQFYVEKLNFDIGFVDDEKNPRYAGVVRDGIELHLQWHDKSEWDNGMDRPLLRILTQKIKLLYEEYKYAGVFHEYTNLEETDWGTLEFSFYDPFKNALIFYHGL